MLLWLCVLEMIWRPTWIVDLLLALLALQPVLSQNLTNQQSKHPPNTCRLFHKLLVLFYHLVQFILM